MVPVKLEANLPRHSFLIRLAASIYRNQNWQTWVAGGGVVMMLVGHLYQLVRGTVRVGVQPCLP
jgi:hypothetical protein